MKYNKGAGAVFMIFMVLFLAVSFSSCSSGGGSSDPAGTGSEASDDGPADTPAAAVYKLTISVSGTGAVSAAPEKTGYAEGESVTITAIPGPGCAFRCWSGDASGYGNEVTTITMNSDKLVSAEFITGAIYYVKSGAAGGDGSLNAPYGDIQTAIGSVSGTASVYVSAGTYNESITMKEGVSLYGGFSADFSGRLYMTEADRDNSSYKTLIKNPSSAVEGTILDPVYAVLFDGTGTAITTSTIIDGFTIHSGIGDADTAVRCKENGSPTIQYNTITGIGNGSNTHYSYGIYSYDSSPVIRYNSIRGVSTDNTASARAVLCNGFSSSLKIAHNTIYGGDNTTSIDGSYGIEFGGSSGGITPVIEYNTITGGDNSRSSLGIRDTTSGSIIRNNIILAGKADSASGAETLGINTYYSNIYNNIIHGGRASGANGNSIGIFSGAGSSKIFNNTICGGSSGHTTRVIHIHGGSMVSVENNILFCESGATGSQGIFASSGYPGNIRNNNIFDCNELFNYNGTDIFTTTSSYETFLNSGTERASGNDSIDLIDNSGSYYFTDWDGADNNIFTIGDNNWHLTSDAPLNVRGGGLSLSGTFTTDYAGTSRTTSTPTGMTNTNAAGWSMGAFEED